MKKLSLLICLFISFNLSAQNSKKDKLIGKWKLYQEIEDGEDTSSECSRKTTIEFFNNGTYSITEYVEESEIDDTCYGEMRKNNWKNIGDSKYIFRGKKTTNIYFEKDMYYFIYTGVDYTIKYVYRRVND